MTQNRVAWIFTKKEQCAIYYTVSYWDQLPATINFLLSKTVSVDRKRQENIWQLHSVIHYRYILSGTAGCALIDAHNTHVYSTTSAYKSCYIKYTVYLAIKCIFKTPCTGFCCML